MRAVLDANVFLAALLSPRGAPAQILLRWLRGDFELVVSERLLSELERALAYPKLRTRIAREDGAELVSVIREGAVLASDPPTPPRRSRDPGDDYLLALAESQNALLVSGDEHLLDLANRFPVRTPRDFLNVLPPDGCP